MIVQKLYCCKPVNYLRSSKKEIVKPQKVKKIKKQEVKENKVEQSTLEQPVVLSDTLR
jgi:hypothetical protein